MINDSKLDLLHRDMQGIMHCLSEIINIMIDNKKPSKHIKERMEKADKCHKEIGKIAIEIASNNLNIISSRKLALYVHRDLMIKGNSKYKIDTLRKIIAKDEKILELFEERKKR